MTQFATTTPNLWKQFRVKSNGHDNTAESAVIAIEYGRLPKFSEHPDCGTGGKNARQEVAERKFRANQVR